VGDARHFYRLTRLPRCRYYLNAFNHYFDDEPVAPRVRSLDVVSASHQ